MESELRAIPVEDRQAVENQLADFLGSALDDPQRFVEAAVNPERLEHYLQQHGGSRLKDSLGGIAGDLFDFLLGEAVLQVSRLAPSSPHFDSTALTNLLRSAEEWNSKLDELLSRPGSRGILAQAARSHLDNLKSFAPPVLKDRETELAELADWHILVETYRQFVSRSFRVQGSGRPNIQLSLRRFRPLSVVDLATMAS